MNVVNFNNGGWKRIINLDQLKHLISWSEYYEYDNCNKGYNCSKGRNNYSSWLVVIIIQILKKTWNDGYKRKGSTKENMRKQILHLRLIM